MPQRSRQRKERRNVVDDVASGGGDRYPLRTTSWFDRSLESLGHPDAQFVLAKLTKGFEKDWLGNVLHTELNSSWEYKMVLDRESCRHLEVRQIRVGKDIRILFTIDRKRRVAHYLEAYHKTGKPAQVAAIARACNRARIIRGENDGRD